MDGIYLEKDVAKDGKTLENGRFVGWIEKNNKLNIVCH